MKTILLVDDEPLVLKATSRGLRLRGFNVVATTDPQQAIELVKKEQFDVVVSDVVMGGMDGFQMKEAICRINPNMADRFIFVSGGGNSAFTRQCLSTIKYLQKPYEFAELLHEIVRITGPETGGSN